MKQEDLRAARLIEAKRRWLENETPRREVEHLADLYEANWTPPEPVDPDAEAATVYANRFPSTAEVWERRKKDFLAGRKSRPEIVWPEQRKYTSSTYAEGWNAAITACRKAAKRGG